MTEDHVGKLSPSRTKDLLSGCFGANCPELIVGPGPGLDAAVLDMGEGRVMAIAEDPIFPAPGLPLEIMGRFTVHIGASDVAVTGIPPRYMTYTLLMPPGCPESDARTIVCAISDAASELGISVVGGHTGWYGAVTIPTVGGVTVWGYGSSAEWVSPGGARGGEVILMTKGPAIEASALLGVIYRDKISDKLDKPTIDSVCSRTDEITVVRDALSAFRTGGVHAMHDATEGGVLGGLYEMSAASGMSVHADLDAVPVPEDIASFAEVLGFDPWSAISEGTLLAAVEPSRAEAVLDVWADEGIQGYRLGTFGPGTEQSTVMRGGTNFPLHEPGPDPFWPLFFAGLPQK